MKVIKHGNTWRHCTCKTCECEIGFCDKETNAYDDYDMGLWISREYLICPECGDRIFVNSYVNRHTRREYDT